MNSFTIGMRTSHLFLLFLAIGATVNICISCIGASSASCDGAQLEYSSNTTSGSRYSTAFDATYILFFDSNNISTLLNETQLRCDCQNQCFVTPNCTNVFIAIDAIAGTLNCTGLRFPGISVPDNQWTESWAIGL